MVLEGLISIDLNVLQWIITYMYVLRLHNYLSIDFEISGEIPMGEFDEHVKRLHSNNNEGFLWEYSVR